MEPQLIDKSPLERLIKSGGYEVSLALLSYILSAEDAPQLTLNLRKTCKVFKEWIDNIPSCKSDEIYSKIPSMIIISLKSLQQFEKCKPPPFITWLKIKNAKYFDQPGLKEEKARLLGYFIDYWAPKIRKMEVTVLTANFVEQTQNKFSILEEMSTNCLLFSPGNQQRLLARLETGYPCLKKVSLPLKSSLLHGLSNLISSKSQQANFELLLTAGHDRNQEGCLDTDWDSRGFERFVSATNESSSLIQLLKISMHRILKIKMDFPAEVYMKFFAKIVWIEKCRFHHIYRLLIPLLNRKAFPNLNRIGHISKSEIPGVLYGLASLNVTHLEISIDTRMPRNLPATLTYLDVTTTVFTAKELHDSLTLVSKQCSLLQRLELVVHCHCIMELNDVPFANPVRFPNLIHLASFIESTETTQTMLFNILRVPEMPLLSFKLHGRYIFGGAPKPIFKGGFPTKIMTGVIADTLLQCKLDGFEIQGPNFVPLLITMVKCNRERFNGRYDEYIKFEKFKNQTLRKMCWEVMTGGDFKQYDLRYLEEMSRMLKSIVFMDRTTKKKLGITQLI